MTVNSPGEKRRSTAAGGDAPTREHLTGIGAMLWQSLRLHKAFAKLFLYHAAPPGGLRLCPARKFP